MFLATPVSIYHLIMSHKYIEACCQNLASFICYIILEILAWDMRLVTQNKFLWIKVKVLNLLLCNKFPVITLKRPSALVPLPPTSRGISKFASKPQ